MRCFLWLATVSLIACGDPSETAGEMELEEAPAFELPVVTNAESPVRYPPALFRRNVGGTVVLRLFVDSAGVVVPESTRVAEGSGSTTLDSVAMAHVPDMQFAPARRNGAPIATTFLQRVVFQPPETATQGAP